MANRECGLITFKLYEACRENEEWVCSPKEICITNIFSICFGDFHPCSKFSFFRTIFLVKGEQMGFPSTLMAVEWFITGFMYLLAPGNLEETCSYRAESAVVMPQSEWLIEVPMDHLEFHWSWWSNSLYGLSQWSLSTSEFWEPLGLSQVKTKNLWLQKNV